ncbi:hypothetical protein GmHk_06G016979 [Glycine max]|uniref:Uncharacterized protein n=1 Tax=Glycine max TaxID=3847 RepID=K7KWN1_SOYBN|nr:hypothetical protein GYH30_015934 [Glycine max]KAH1246993.1 hypothetical protein GmHk_06G016979 [Glycine max]
MEENTDGDDRGCLATAQTDEQRQNTVICATNGSAMARCSETSASRAVGGHSTPPRNRSAIDHYANWAHFSVSTCRGSLIPQLSMKYCDATEIPLHHNLWHELAWKRAPDA